MSAAPGDDRILLHLGEIVRLSAKALERLSKPITESVLKRELRFVTEHMQEFELDEAERKVNLAGWPGVGGVDIAATTEGDEIILIELKWGAGTLYNCAWDAPKLATALREGEGSRAFLVAGAPLADWHSPSPGAGLLGSAEWDSAALVDRHAAAFAKWRGDVATRPREIPDRFATKWVAEARLVVEGQEWAVRCAEVAVPSGGLLAVGEDGRTKAIPSGLPPRIEPVDEIRPSQREVCLFAGEGGSVYLASQTELLVDESGMADFMPTDEADTSLENLYTFVSPADLAAHARDRRWLEERRKPEDPAALYVTISGQTGALEIRWDAPDLLITTDRRTRRATPVPSDWQAFWARAEDLDAWNWKSLYTADDMATDGLGFRLVMAHRGRLVDSTGYRAFPPTGAGDPASLGALLEPLGVRFDEVFD